MKECPILMSSPMVRAILAGNKNQTRRIMYPQPLNHDHSAFIEAEWKNEFPEYYNTGNNEWCCRYCGEGIGLSGHSLYKCKYGEVGDVLWVRETTYHDDNGYLYRADTNDGRPYDLSDAYCINEWGLQHKDMWPKWKPSIFMPKEACRIHLKITDIRVEKLQDISQQDCIDEGIESKLVKIPSEHGGITMVVYKVYGTSSSWDEDPKVSYRSLWEKINGPESWKSNPWIWRISFLKID